MWRPELRRLVSGLFGRCEPHWYAKRHDFVVSYKQRPASDATAAGWAGGPGARRGFAERTTRPKHQNPVAFVILTNGLVSIQECLVGYSWCRLTFQGQSAWASASYLVAVQNNQLISDTGAQLGIPTTQPPQPPANPTPTANQVCFYSDPNFGGNAFCSVTGQTNFNLGPPWNNTISSIRVGNNAAVAVCGDPNLAGWCQTYTDNVNLTSFRNDTISSYRVISANTPSPAAQACFFENANYAWRSVLYR